VSAAGQGFATFISGLAGAGSNLASSLDEQEQARLRQEAARQQLEDLNRRTQEILDQQRAASAGIDLNGAKENMGPTGSALFQSLPAGEGGSVPGALADKIQRATSGQTNGGVMDPVLNAGNQVFQDQFKLPTQQIPVPQVGVQKPAQYENVLANALAESKPQAPTAAGTNDYIAARLRAGMELGIPMKDLHEMSQAGEFTQNLAKNVADERKDIRGNQAKIGTDFLKEAGDDRRQGTLLAYDRERDAMRAKLEERIARLHEAGRSKAADKAAKAATDVALIQMKANLNVFEAARKEEEFKLSAIADLAKSFRKAKPEEQLQMANANGLKRKVASINTHPLNPFASPDTTYDWDWEGLRGDIKQATNIKLARLLSANQNAQTINGYDDDPNPDFAWDSKSDILEKSVHPSGARQIPRP